MTNPYPKPRWDLENDVLRLEQMIILYEQEIAELKLEKEELQEEVTLLKRKLSYYKTIAYFEEEVEE
jgi:cell division protein FtsB